MKKVNFRLLSDKRCVVPGCRKRLKQNVANRNPNADMCYKHYQQIIRQTNRHGTKITPDYNARQYMKGIRS